MTKQKSDAGQSKQSADQPASTSNPSRKPVAGKDAASHTKAGSDKGAGGGKKQERKH